MKKVVNIILIAQTIFFYSAFVLDFSLLFPNHWATLVAFHINPILSLIGLIPALWHKPWLAILGLILYFCSFPLCMIAGSVLAGLTMDWSKPPMSLPLEIILGVWGVFLLIGGLGYLVRGKAKSKLDDFTFGLIYLPPLLGWMIVTFYSVR